MDKIQDSTQQVKDMILFNGSIKQGQRLPIEMLSLMNV